MDVAEMQGGNSHVQYPKFGLFEKLVSPIAKLNRLHAMVQNISSTTIDFSQTLQKISTAISDLSINVKQLLSKSNERGKPHQFDCGLSSQQFPLSSEEELQMLETGLRQKETMDRLCNEREKPHQFDCGLSSQQFPLSSEEELQMLDTGLSQKETMDRFMAMGTRLSSDDPKTSMRFVLSHLLTPEVASALTNRFLSSSVNEKDLGKLYDIATQGYFHDIRDKMIKRNKRKENQVILNNNELAIALDMQNNRCLSFCSSVVQ
ncbi:unnamed protein product [Schistosoma mattheei]|uniref:Uncharacterized protein n=1 Tax=Schistosoma mattheei TaxID=31246 RepID=A0A183PUV6_9TREM|nr:unnamed protein product [Schistosoma mattheei]